MKQIIIDVHGTPYSFDSRTESRPINVREVVAQKIFPQLDIQIARHKVLVSPQGSLFNPSEPGVDINQVDRHKTDLSNVYFYNLRRCSQQCYDDYTIFLRSRNKTHLLIAQRRFHDES